jgi:hypothetical protein
VGFPAGQVGIPAVAGWVPWVTAVTYVGQATT